MAKTFKYYTVVGVVDGHEEIIFGSYYRKDCKYELESERDGLKDQGYKKIRITVSETDVPPDGTVYKEELEQEQALKEAQEIHELQVSLENISHDDGKELSAYSILELASEAAYVLSTFKEGGHCNNDDLHDDDQVVRAFAGGQVKQLQKYIKKWGDK